MAGALHIPWRLARQRRQNLYLQVPFGIQPTDCANVKGKEIVGIFRKGDFPEQDLVAAGNGLARLAPEDFSKFYPLRMFRPETQARECFQFLALTKDQRIKMRMFFNRPG